jgi:hypothetical protein
MNDQDFDSMFENESQQPLEQTDASSGGPVRSVEEFEAEVRRQIAILSSAKNPVKARVEAALWLGESAQFEAIRPLIAVYKRDTKNPKVQQAAAYALGMFKTLDAAIYREAGETVEDAIYSPENADVLNTITAIVFYDKRGRRRGGGGLLRLMGVLVLILAALTAAYLFVPQGGLTQLLTIPTATPTPTIDPNAPTATPTPTETEVPTETPTPTATPGIPPQELRAILSDLYTLIDRSTAQRDFLQGLETVWTALSNDLSQTSIANACRAQPPDVPADYRLSAEYAAILPALREAVDYVNTGLALSRDGWRYFRDGCNNGDVASRVQTGLSIIQTARSSFASARRILDGLR